ncbi:MAG: ribose-5-phosphate isomerase RpiA [Proteobacteria bacterium]|nr:ribose-5-phosphate isomerase RpiA [Pseudomonadota bacterium]
MKSNEAMKQAAALAALEKVEVGSIIGVGTGSTVNYFIEGLGKIKSKIDGAVASSTQTERLLRQQGIAIYDLNEVGSLSLYVDGADEFNEFFSLIKGGGGALTREKIIAASSENFLCIVDSAKKVKKLGNFPVPIEVIPMARSYVARQIVKMGADPVYREGFKTDNGNVILYIHNLDISEPIAVETALNNIVGVVANGIFAHRGADCIYMGTSEGVEKLTSPK